MVEEILKMLNPKSDGIYLDGTLGGGGHTEMLLQESSPNGRVIGIDKDTDAIAFASERLSGFGQRFTAVHSDYSKAAEVLDELGIDLIDGAILDLGVSSFQLDSFDRGFSYRASDSPLDMRMDKTSGFSAKDVINGYSKEDLERIFREYGEERFSRKIAEKIVETRKNKQIETCGELVKIIVDTIPMKFQQDGHPAKRVFQAIRIEVNNELEPLRKSVESIIRRLKVGGRLCVITFHSLEDRIVKNLMKHMATDCICDKSLPVCVCDKVKEVEVITNKPIVATIEEQRINPRSKSAKLRVCERITTKTVK